MKNMNEHKKGVKAKIYNKKPVPLVGPEALKKKEQQKKATIGPSQTKKVPEAFKMPPMSAQEKLYKKHQEIRKKRGAPDPEYYKKLAQQKQREIDDMNKKDDVNEAEMGKIVDYKAGQTATLASGPGMTTIIDLKKNPTSLSKDPATGKLKLSGPQATGTPQATANQASTIKAGDAVEISTEDDLSRMKNLAGIQEAPQAATPAAPATQQPAPAQSKPGIKVPPTPALPQLPQGIEGEKTQDGGVSYSLDGGAKLTANQDGTKSYSGEWGSFTYDKTGKAIKYQSPSIGGLGGEVDLTSGDQTTSYNSGDLSVSQTQTPGGYTKQKDQQYNLGLATVGQKTVGPNIAAGQLAGTTTNTVTNNQTGQAKQQVQGVAFGGASGKNVGNNTVGATNDELAQYTAKTATGLESILRLAGLVEHTSRKF